MFYKVLIMALTLGHILTSTTYAEGLIAHRGASLLAPENTLSAIQKAIELKADFVEIDVQMTKDNYIIAIHDENIKRTTTGKGQVQNLVLPQIRLYDAGSWFSKDFSFEKIPTLDEVLNTIRGKEISLIIEVKNVDNKYPNIEKIIVDIVKRSQVNNTILYKSFSPEVLTRFKSLDDRELIYATLGEISFLNITIDDWLRTGSLFDIDYVKYYQVHKYFITNSLIKKAHGQKKKVIVWDVNSVSDYLKYKKMGIDLIETDNPLLKKIK